jgi:large subunit ribosomal protein L15
MRLHNIVNSEGATHSTKRLGRGRGSGHGKTSSRGGKGQTARSGSSQRPGFESGHVPLYRKLPKHGFNRARFQVSWSTINIGSFAALPENITEVTREVLVAAGLVRNDGSLLKILGDGQVERAFTVVAQKFSASAKEKIEKAGGKVVVLSDAPAAE